MSSTPNKLFPATKCIDGNTEGPDLDKDVGGIIKVSNMCHTQNEPAPWIAIDYSVNVTVQRVEIFNRRECCGDRTQNLDVIISNELPTSANKVFFGGTEFDHFRGPATDGEQIIMSGDKVPPGEVASGRYVIVQMNNGKGNPLNLQEVKAFGSWPKGNK